MFTYSTGLQSACKYQEDEVFVVPWSVSGTPNRAHMLSDSVIELVDVSEKEADSQTREGNSPSQREMDLEFSETVLCI